MTDPARIEKAGLLTVTFACIFALTWIGIKSLGSDKLDPNAATLLGAIVAGLIATAGACIQALRGFSMGAALSKVTDQLAASSPIDPLKAAEPVQVQVINAPGDPVPVKDNPDG